MVCLVKHKGQFAFLPLLQKYDNSIYDTLTETISLTVFVTTWSQLRR
jgi:hypothetical protein